jgi:hypothetical protein
MLLIRCYCRSGSLTRLVKRANEYEGGYSQRTLSLFPFGDPTFDCARGIALALVFRFAGGRHWNVVQFSGRASFDDLDCGIHGGILRRVVFSRNPKWCEHEITQLSYGWITLRFRFARRDNGDAKSKQSCVY